MSAVCSPSIEQQPLPNEPPRGPTSLNRFSSVGSASASTTAAWSLATISFGVTLRQPARGSYSSASSPTSLRSDSRCARTGRVAPRRRGSVAHSCRQTKSYRAERLLPVVAGRRRHHRLHQLRVDHGTPPVACIRLWAVGKGRCSPPLRARYRRSQRAHSSTRCRGLPRHDDATLLCYQEATHSGRRVTHVPDHLVFGFGSDR